jgi:hypothetical protein
MEQTITLPLLATGETYAGLILNADGTPSHHLILLNGDKSLTWEKAKAFATKASGDLPTRQEQALLFANCKAQFKADWYWSGEAYASGSGYAWYQDFGYGTQCYDDILIKLRARAVRRLPI